MYTRLIRENFCYSPILLIKNLDKNRHVYL